jgi:hypothetical protein
MVSLSLSQCVADTHQFDADPDPARHFDADPDPPCHFAADPDPALQMKAQNLAKMLKLAIFHTFWLVICKFNVLARFGFENRRVSLFTITYLTSLKVFALYISFICF